MPSSSATPASAPPRDGPTTRSCCSRRSPGSPRGSGSPRRCSRSGVARRRRSRWPRPSLQRASDGRFALGLGASSPPLVEGLHGITWQQPLDRMRTTLVAVRALLEGARLPLDREDVRPLRLGAPPERPVPILLAALAPSSVRLAGELADQWLPFLWARSRIPDGRTLLAEGEAAAEDSTATGVTASVPLAIARTRRRPGRSPPVGCSRTSRAWVRCIRGCSATTSASRARSMRCSTPTGTAGPPRLPARSGAAGREVTVMGTYEEAPDAVGAWLEAGADTIDLVLAARIARRAAPRNARGGLCSRVGRLALSRHTLCDPLRDSDSRQVTCCRLPLIRAKSATSRQQPQLQGRPRNEGVPGSNPGVGSSRNPLGGVRH